MPPRIPRARLVAVCRRIRGLAVEAGWTVRETTARTSRSRYLKLRRGGSELLIRVSDHPEFWGAKRSDLSIVPLGNSWRADVEALIHRGRDRDMIKFVGQKDGQKLFGFGLSEGNLERLRKGEPIVVDLAVMGAAGTVMIFYGRTEEEMARMLTTAGLVAADTEIRKQTNPHGG